MDYNINTNYPIAALATAKGVGAIAVIRISGSDLTPLIQALTNGIELSHRMATYVSLFYPGTARLLDKCILTYFKAPHSFTGEDVLEISCHGGDYVPQTILDSLYSADVRVAGPGEFSYRAFLNNKIDLVQAESVASLISSKASHSADVSLNNLTGYFSKTIINLRTRLLDLLSVLEKELDFSEEEISFISKKSILDDLSILKKSFIELLNTAQFGKIISSGLRVVLLGRPNVGKSSLFNHLLGNDRSIVSELPGTTRDTIEAWTEIDGYPICLVDTAGCWESEDYLESLGIERTINELGNADLVLFIDDINPVKEFQSLKLKELSDKIIFIKSKTDKDKTNQNETFGISVKNGKGILELIEKITSFLGNYSNTNNNGLPIIASSRQKSLIERSVTLTEECIRKLENDMEVDLIISELRGIITNLENIIGVIPNDEVMENIFKNFCIGK